MGNAPSAVPQTRTLRDAASGAVLVPRLRVATTAWTRMKGLLGTAGLEPDEGLLITPSNQVHTIGMRYPLDLVFVDAENRIVGVQHDVRPGQISTKMPAATAVLELPAGALDRLAMAEGARLEVEPPPVVGRRALQGVATATSNVLLAILYALFIAAHVTRLSDPAQRPHIIPLIVLETIIVMLFITRRRAQLQSRRPLDWVFGLAGCYVPFLLRPRGPIGVFAPVGEVMGIVGVSVAAVAVIFLGRSFGIVPANRGVKTGGAYGMVRHPMYAGYFLTYVGYVVSYPSVTNVLLTIGTLAIQVTRAMTEERLLARDPLYREYLRRTPWRFIPYVY